MLVSPECGSDRLQGVLLPQATEREVTGPGGRRQQAGWRGSLALVPPERTLQTELVKRHRQTRRRFSLRLGVGCRSLTETRTLRPEGTRRQICHSAGLASMPA